MIKGRLKKFIKRPPDKFFVKLTYNIVVIIGVVLVLFGIALFWFFCDSTYGNKLDYYLKFSSLMMSFITFILGGGLYFQLYYSRKSTDDNFERARREKTVDLSLRWSSEYKKEHLMAKKIVQKLDDDSCRKLNKLETFLVSKELYKDIRSLLYDEDIIEEKKLDDHSDMNSCCKSSEGQKEKNECCESQQKTKLTEKEVLEIRSYIINYLNLLESILLAWYYHVADRKIIEDEFEYLITEDNGANALENFRKATNGNNNFPCIERFCLEIKKKKEKKLNDTEKLMG